MDRWFTSDFHLTHENMRRFAKRPWGTVVEPTSEFKKDQIDFVTNIFNAPIEAKVDPCMLKIHPCVTAYANPHMSCPAKEQYYEILNGELYKGCP